MAGKRQQTMGQLHGSLHRIARHFHIGLYPLQAPLLKAPLQQFEATTDTRQQVVHLVAHAPGQLANHLHPFVVAHQRFRLACGLFAVFGDIPTNRSQQVAIEAGTPAKTVIMAIAVTQAGLQLLGIAVLQEAGHGHLHFGTIRRMHQFQYRQVAYLLVSPAQNAVPGGVGGMQLQFRGNGHHRITRQLPDLLALGHMPLYLPFKALRLLPPMMMRLNAGRGLDHRVQKTRHVAKFIVQWCITERAPQRLAAFAADDTLGRVLDKV
ncbi:hypothetical protein D3C79_656570 [compost metagenome]